MGQQVFEQWAEWDGCATSYDAMVEDGKRKIADLVQALHARGLPPGAVIEIDFAVRRRKAGPLGRTACSGRHSKTQANRRGHRWVSKRWILALLAALLLLLLGSAAGAAILSGSDRPVTGSPSDQALRRFDGVGKIQCAGEHYQNRIDVGTGWIVGSADTVVTAAHLFFPRLGRESAASMSTIDPKLCRFALYDSDRNIREVARIRYAVSPWSDIRLRNDSSHDVAVLKLDRAVAVTNVPAVKISNPMFNSSIELVAFHTEMVDSERALVTTGELVNFPLAPLPSERDGARISNASRLFAASADSTPGSSGGMYYNERQQVAVGVHIGSLCAEGRHAYDPTACFNYGLRFNRKIVAMIASVAANQPHMGELIRMPDTRPQLAMASEPRG